MEVTWTNTFTTYFDLDQAEEDFRYILSNVPHKDPETAIYDAVEANWYFDHNEIIDVSSAIEQCARALRTRIGGIQIRMDL